jgi:signal transduction histidine kinase
VTRPASLSARQTGLRRGLVVARLREWFVRMGFRTKFLVVGLLVAGPLSMLAGFAASQFHTQVQQAQMRAESLDRAARARDLIEALALHRGLTASVLAGGEDLSRRLVQQQAQVESALLRMLAVLPAPGSRAAQPDSALPPAQELAAEVRSLKALPDAMDPLRNFERHNRVIDQLVVLMQNTGSRGATSNGPQLAGAYELSFVALPSLLESLGRQRGWGSAVLQLEQFSNGEIARHLMFAGAVARQLELLEADPRSLPELDRLTTARGLAAGTVAQRVKAATAEVEVFSQRSIAQVLARSGGSVAAQQHFVEGTLAIERVLSVSREVSDTLYQRTLAQQKRAELLRLASLLGLALVVLALALVYREFARTTVSRLNLLKQASSRMAGGVFEDTVAVEGSDEIAALADALDAMRRRLRQAVEDGAQALSARESERTRTEFLARWSHDLRTPLAAVMGFARLMAERDEGQLSAHQRDDLQRIQTATEHLLRLVDDVLAVSSHELRAWAGDLQPLDALAVAHDAVALNLPAAQRRGVRVTVCGTGWPAVAADRTRLLQVLGNLVGNAVKFNHDGGWVELRSNVEGPELRLDVVDSGPGIAAEALPRLFRPFERLDADRRGVPGTGLGLATCKLLVEAMGGRIGVDSQPGAGTRFSAWLRLATDERPRIGALRGRVAYVEDNETNVELLRAMLAARAEVALTVFDSGQAARRSTARFDLWIIDLQLPDTDGVSLLKALRQLHGEPLKAVLFTADVLPQSRSEAMAAGFADCWTKPMPLDALESALRRLLPG